MEHGLHVSHQSNLVQAESGEHPDELVGQVWSLQHLRVERHPKVLNHTVKHDAGFVFIGVHYWVVRQVSDLPVLSSNLSWWDLNSMSLICPTGLACPPYTSLSASHPSLTSYAMNSSESPLSSCYQATVATHVERESGGCSVHHRIPPRPPTLPSPACPAQTSLGSSSYRPLDSSFQNPSSFWLSCSNRSPCVKKAC